MNMDDQLVGAQVSDKAIFLLPFLLFLLAFGGFAVPECLWYDFGGNFRGF